MNNAGPMKGFEHIKRYAGRGGQTFGLQRTWQYGNFIAYVTYIYIYIIKPTIQSWVNPKIDAWFAALFIHWFSLFALLRAILLDIAQVHLIYWTAPHKATRESREENTGEQWQQADCPSSSIFSPKKWGHPTPWQQILASFQLKKLGWPRSRLPHHPREVGVEQKGPGYCSIWERAPTASGRACWGHWGKPEKFDTRVGRWLGRWGTDGEMGLPNMLSVPRETFN